jgi:hypothetical protein
MRALVVFTSKPFFFGGCQPWHRNCFYSLSDKLALRMAAMMTRSSALMAMPHDLL